MKEAIIQAWRKLQGNHTYAHSLVIISLVVAGLGLRVKSVARLSYSFSETNYFLDLTTIGLLLRQNKVDCYHLDINL